MGKPIFADHFSAGASNYARYRPSYPSALFEWLADITDDHRRAWDCATGNGQAAIALAEHFEEVIATDASEAQLGAAAPHARVRYLCAPAERTGLHDRSMNLVTVAQALHWLDVAAFHREVNRVVVRGGVIAVWSYGPVQVDRSIDELVNELYHCTLGSHWPTARAHVDTGYRDLAFPFATIEPPEFVMSTRWTLAELLGYVGTWSAAQRYVRAIGGEALGRFAEQMAACWGNPDEPREVRWPLTVRAGQVGAGRQ